MRSKPSSCSTCAICDHGSDFSAIEGTGANGVMLVGEASGQMEARDQLPFRPYAPAGSVLERCLRRMGLDRKQFSVTNVIRCRPRHDFLENAPWEYAAIRQCRPNLDAAIKERKPKVIVALGGTAFRELTGIAGEAQGVTHMAGYVQPIYSSKSETFICGMCEGQNPQCDHCFGTGKITRHAIYDSIPVICNFHPSYLRRGKASHQGVFSRILHRAIQIAKGADREWMWNVDPSDCSTWNLPSTGTILYDSKNAAQTYSGLSKTRQPLVLQMPYKSEIDEPQVLPSLQSRVDAFLSQRPSADDIAEAEKQLQALRPSLSSERQAREEALRTLWEYKQSDAPSRLQQAAVGGVAVPGLPSEAAPRRLNYWTKPTLEQCWSIYHYLKDNPNLWVAKDLETYESASIDEDAREGFQDTQIRLFQLSYQPGTGVAIPYDGSFKVVIRDMVNLPNNFYGHNWDNFDHKVLRAASAREGWKYAPPVRCYDTLDMFHHWQPDLPAHLQFAASFIRWPFPWKHLAGTDIEFYGICDVDADLQLGHFLVQMLKKDGIWGRGEQYDVTCGYTGQVRELRPVLAAMEDRGVPIDNARRMKLGEDFRIAADVIAQKLMGLYPESAKKLEPYKKLPPELKGLPEAEWGKLFREEDRWKCKCGRNNNRMEDAQCECGRAQEDGSVKSGKWYRYAQREVEESTVTKSTQMLIDDEAITSKVLRWCYIPEFNPNSRSMVIEYMKFKGHAVPKSKEEDWEGNQKETTASKELQRLAAKTGDTFYLDVVEYRGLSKMQGTYVEGFKPSADGCVHTTFTTSTAIGQLASHNPNVQNFPKLKPTPALAKAMREMIAPKPGNVITEWDYKSCHALTLGYLAQSHRYMRMARLDIHSFVAGHFLNLWDARQIEHETDDELKARFKWLKSDPERKRIRDDQAKHSILGIGNGLRAKGLFERYMEQFPPRICPDCSGAGKVQGVRGLKICLLCRGIGKQGGLSIALQFEQLLRGVLFPEVFEWQDRVQMDAHEKRQLVTEFGHIRRFYEVKRWDGKINHGKGGWGHGDQAEESIAYWLANIAFAHIRESMKELDRLDYAEHYGLFNNVHDSFMFHFSREKLEDHKRHITPVLLAPSKILTNPKVAPGGLVIDVEGSWTDRDWAHMKDLFEPEPPRVKYDGEKFTYLEAATTAVA